jgi:hypothetical protein
MPFGMAKLTSIRELPSIERFPDFTHAPFRQVGVGFHNHNEPQTMTSDVADADNSYPKMGHRQSARHRLAKNAIRQIGKAMNTYGFVTFTTSQLLCTRNTMRHQSARSEARRNQL